MLIPPFTPAPWRVSRSGLVVHAGPVVITQTVSAPRAVMIANAHLIAASPAMFGALLGADELLLADGWRVQDGLGGETVRAVQLALATARGER